MPLGGGNARLLEIDGKPLAAGEQAQTVTQVPIGPRYFETTGVRLVMGRDFDNVDGTSGHESAIINQRFASTHFGTRIPSAVASSGTTTAPRPPGTTPHLRHHRRDRAVDSTAQRAGTATRCGGLYAHTGTGRLFQYHTITSVIGGSPPSSRSRVAFWPRW